jgi:4-aminobutyrate aminotransferase
VDLAFERGLLLLGCGKSTIRFSPPLCIDKETVDEGLMIFEDAVSIAEQTK